MENNGEPSLVAKRKSNQNSSRHQRGQIVVPVSRESHPGQKYTANLLFIDWNPRHLRTKCANIFTKKASRSQTSGYSDPPSKGQKPQKSEWPKSMKQRPRTLPSGLSTAKSAIGTANPDKTEVNGPKKGEKTRIGLSNSSLFWSIFLSFCVSLTFAATNITIATHNLHGYKKCSSYHRSCLQRHEGIWMGQELWLTERQHSTMSNLGTQFTARSAMEDAISAGIFRGRPFGGVSIAWSPKLNSFIRPLTNFRHKRVVGVEIKYGKQQNTVHQHLYALF